MMRYKIPLNFYVIFPILLILIIPPVFAELQEDRDSLLEIGEKLILEKDYELAIRAFDLILEIDPNDPDVLFKMAEVFSKLEKINEALENIEKALELNPNHIDALTFKANNLVKENQTSLAKPIYEKIVSVDPENPAALGFIGDSLKSEGKTRQALPYYEKVVFFNQYQHDPHGIAYFDKLLEINHNDENALNAKGTSLVKLGRSEGGFTVIYIDNLEEAISYFDKVLEKNPNNINSLLNKGKALFQLGDGKTGMEYVDQVLSLEPSNIDALTFKADELIKSNQTNDALKLIDHVLEIEPKFVDALFLKGRTLIFYEKYNDAFYYFDEVLELNPNHIIAAKNIKLISDVLGHVPLDGFLDVKIHDSQGLLAGHLRVNDLKLFNHTYTENLVNEWPVSQIITRNGQEYEVLEHHISKNANLPKYNGGAVHFGIRYAHYDQVWDILANYWMYRVQPGDTIDFTYTAFRPVA